MARKTAMHAKHVSAARIRRLPVLLLLLICLLLAGTLTARADERWSDAYYRATDATEKLTDLETESIEGDCIEFMEKYGADFACLSLAPEYHSSTSLRELAEQYYPKWEYGYGEGKDGFFFLFDVETGEGEIIPFGRAAEMVPEDYLKWAAKNSLEFYEEYGIHGVMYGGVGYTASYLDDHPEVWGSAAAAQAAAGTSGAQESQLAEGAQESQPAEGVQESQPAEGAQESRPAEGAQESQSAEGAKEQQSGGGTQWTRPAADTNVRVGEDSQYPAWYPADPEHFAFYHDDGAPRVVDDADIFTDEEEAQMETRLKEIRGELNKDIVVYTNKSACGLGHDIMAADFFDFNGYGCGDEYEGACLYVCMDPEDRGWWVACTGTETMELYTEEFANDMDDELYHYMAGGEYGAGAMDWIENFRTLYVKGMPFAPDWYPDRSEGTPERFHDSAAPRVVDDAKLLTEEERQELTAYAKKISDTYGKDVVIHTARNSCGMYREEYARLFYEYNGYGFGDNYDGILLVAFKREGYSPSNEIYASGSGLDRLTEVNRDRMHGYVEDGMYADKYYMALNRFLQQTEHMERTGRVPRSMAYWIFISLFGSASGGIFGAVSLLRARARMEVPKIQENADAYLVPGTLKVRRIGEAFLGKSVTTKYIPPVSRSSGGSSSSSGRSSYRSSYRGSSGRSHSGSGRRF